MRQLIGGGAVERGFDKVVIKLNSTLRVHSVAFAYSS